VAPLFEASTVSSPLNRVEDSVGAAPESLEGESAVVAACVEVIFPKGTPADDDGVAVYKFGIYYYHRSVFDPLYG